MGSDADSAQCGGKALFEFVVIIFRQQDFHLGQGGTAHWPVVGPVQRSLAQGVARQHGQVEWQLVGRKQQHRILGLFVAAVAQSAYLGLDWHTVFTQIQLDRGGIVAEHMQADRRMYVGGALKHGTDQAWLEPGKKAHCLDRGLSSLEQQLWLAVGVKQALVLAQRLFDFQIARQRLGFKNAQALGSFQLGVVEIADAVLAHQACGLLGNTQPISLQSVMRMDTVMFASRHGTSLVVR